MASSPARKAAQGHHGVAEAHREGVRDDALVVPVPARNRGKPLGKREKSAGASSPVRLRRVFIIAVHHAFVFGLGGVTV